MADKPTGGRLEPEASSTDAGSKPAPLCSRDHIAGFDPDRDLGYPGEFPFTRGIQPTMYRGRFWTMRQYAGFGTARQTNERFRYLLSQGQTGLSVAFDLPTQMGYDSDHSMSLGEVGRSGVAIDSVEDMEELLEGIPLDKVSVSMTINATAATLLCLYVAVARKRGIPMDSLSGTVQNDVLKEYAARGTYIYPPVPSMRLVTDTLAFADRHLPRWNPISVSGYHMREAGCDAAQEVGFTLANGIAYLEAARRAGLSLTDLAPHISFFFAAHNDLLEEIAKFRAARRLWARLMKERFQLTEPKAAMLRFHTQTAGSTLTAQQPENNVVRVAIQALAGVLGGTQSLHTNSMDEALSLPTQTAATVALRTQQIIAEESGITNTIDPLAGSYYIESLTSQIEEQAREKIAAIDAMGGAVVAIERGYIQQQIQDTAFKHQTEVESGERAVVGVNKYNDGRATEIALHRLDHDLERAQVERVRAVRSSRDGTGAASALQAVEQAARGTENLLPRILDAVEARATLGEIADALRKVFTTYRESSL